MLRLHVSLFFSHWIDEFVPSFSLLGVLSENNGALKIVFTV